MELLTTEFYWHSEKEPYYIGTIKTEYLKPSINILVFKNKSYAIQIIFPSIISKNQAINEFLNIKTKLLNLYPVLKKGCYDFNTLQYLGAIYAART